VPLLVCDLIAEFVEARKVNGETLLNAVKAQRQKRDALTALKLLTLARA
jgi:hypothetical protein